MVESWSSLKCLADIVQSFQDLSSLIDKSMSKAFTTLCDRYVAWVAC